jgi:uncharacterized membrane protein
MMTAIGVSIVLLGNGVTAGVMLATAIGIVPLTLVLPYRQYVQAIQFLWPRYDPFMPIVHAATVVVGALLAVTVPAGPARVLFGTATLTLVAVMVISVIKNVPLNRYVMSLDPNHQPDDWVERDPRPRWRVWNLLRTSLAVLALLFNATAAASL